MLRATLEWRQETGVGKCVFLTISRQLQLLDTDALGPSFGPLCAWPAVWPTWGCHPCYLTHDVVQCGQYSLQANPITPIKPSPDMLSTATVCFFCAADNLQRSEFVDTPFMREGWVYVDGNDSEGRSVVVSRQLQAKLFSKQEAASPC
jgi:hypothetical protein